MSPLKSDQKTMKFQINQHYVNKLDTEFSLHLPGKMDLDRKTPVLITELINAQAKHEWLKPNRLQINHLVKALARGRINSAGSQIAIDDDFYQWFHMWHFQRTHRIVNCTAWELMQHIKKGYSFMPVYKNAWRKSENFIEANHIALDFDGGHISLSDHAKNRLAQNSAYLSYTSPSHMKNGKGHRNRVVFFLEKPITCSKHYRRAVVAVKKAYRYESDPTGKDAARFWYGSKGCAVGWFGNILTTKRLDHLIDVVTESKKEEIDYGRTRVVWNNEMDSAERLAKASINTLMTNLAGTTAEKHKTLFATARAMGGYVSGKFLTESEAIHELEVAVRKMPDIKSFAIAKDTIRDGLKAGMNSPISRNKILKTSAPRMTESKRRNAWQG